MRSEIVTRFKNELQRAESELLSTLNSDSELLAPVETGEPGELVTRATLIKAQQIAAGVKTRQQQQLAKIRNALEAIKKGSYGTCRKCGGEISLERLEAQPEAFLCVSCAAAVERR